ncbi:MAG: VPLPA-CTERM sorting domain-containing protein [Pseudomonadota bacterium]
MMRHVRVAAIAAAVTFSAGAAQAVTITNGSFEAAFAGWSLIGVTSIETAAFGTGPTAGTNQALLDTTSLGAGASDAAIEGFLGAALGSLDAASATTANGGDATIGSAILQSVTTVVGEEISFDFNFATNEATPTVFNDAAFFYADGAFTLLSDTNDPGFSTSSTAFNEETGFSTFNYVFTTSGVQNIGFVVLNEEDGLVNSGLLVDNIVGNTSAVPLPGTLALMLAALGGFVLIGRRRRMV